MPPEKAPLKSRAASPDNKKLPRYFIREEVHRILSTCTEHHKTEIYFLVSFLWCTGIRVSEATAIKVEDVSLADHTVAVRSLRRRDGHIRLIPIRTDFAAEIAVWIQHKQLKAGDRLFPVTRKTAYNWVVWACRESGFRDGRTHPQVFRHSFAVNLLNQGIPITVVQECLGHMELAETLVYTKIVASNPLKLFDHLEF
jgi:site-specific recombinase XerD